jgi:ribosomal-protein-alanine N-acetyltransferase
VTGLPRTQPVLESEQVRLRPLRPEDTEALQRANDEEILRWSSPQRIDEAGAAALLRDAGNRWMDRRGGLWAIAEPGADELAGTAGLTLYPGSRGSIGYDVAPWARRRGLATGALRLLSDWAFETLPELVRLELWVIPGNEGSLAVARRAGYRQEGVFRSRLPFGEELRDVVVLSLLRDDPRRAPL